MSEDRRAMVARLERELTCRLCGIYRYSIFHSAKCSDPPRRPKRKRRATS